MSVLVRKDAWRCEECQSPWWVTWFISDEIREVIRRDSLRSNGTHNPNVVVSHAFGVKITNRARALAHWVKEHDRQTELVNVQ